MGDIAPLRQQIAVRLNVSGSELRVSYSTIYRAIHAGQLVLSKMSAPQRPQCFPARQGDAWPPAWTQNPPRTAQSADTCAQEELWLCLYVAPVSGRLPLAEQKG